jgi:hypothetical protein
MSYFWCLDTCSARHSPIRRATLPRPFQTWRQGVRAADAAGASRPLSLPLAKAAVSGPNPSVAAWDADDAVESSWALERQTAERVTCFGR